MQENYWNRVPRKRLSRRRFLVASGSTATAALLAACGGGGDDSAATNNATVGRTATGPAGSPPAAAIKRGGLLVTTIGQDYDSVDPHTYIPSTTEETFRAVYETLVGASAEGAYSPERSVSEKWEQVSDTEFVFSLRQGVKFHDGSALTADVVKWNLEDMVDPARNSPRKGPFAVIARAEAVDATHLRLVLKEPNAGFFGDLNHPSASIISRTAFEKLGVDGIKGTPVGTGPFKLKEWRRGASFEVEAFKDYWEKASDGQPLPYLDGIRWDIVPDAGVRAEALATGKIHMLTGLTTETYNRFKSDKKFVIDSYIGDVMGGMSLNHSIAPLDKFDNCRAIWAAIDRQKVIDIVQGGRGRPAYGAISPTMHKWAWAGDTLDVPKGPDPKRVKELLASAGNPNGFDLPMITYVPSTLTDELEVMQAQLTPFGINMKIQTYDVATASAKMWTTDKNMPAFYAGYSNTVDPNLKLAITHASTGAYCAEPASYKAQSEYFQTMDKLLAQGNSTYDLAKRKAAYKALDEANGKYAGYMTLFHRQTDTALAVSVQGYDHGPDNKKRLMATWLKV